VAASLSRLTMSGTKTVPLAELQKIDPQAVRAGSMWPIEYEMMKE